MDQAFSGVARLDHILLLFIRLGIFLGFAHHRFDILVRQATGCLNGDLLLFAGALVFGRHGNDTVCVDVKSNLDLRYTAWRGRDLFKIELAEHLVIGSHLALTLEHTDCHSVLVIFGSREHLTLFSRDRGVTVDQACEHTTQSFDTKRQRCHIQKNNVFNVALKDTGLNSSAHGNNFVRINTFVWLFTEESSHFFDNFRHTRHTANQNNLVDVALGQASVFQRRCAWLHGSLDQITNQRFQFRTGQFQNQVQRLACFRVHRDERHVDFSLRSRRQFDFRFLRTFFQTLKRHFVVLQINAVFFFEFFGKVFNDTHIEVFTTKECITVGRFHFEQAVVDFQNGHIECTTTKVINSDCFAAFFIKAICQRSGCWLVDNTQHFEAGNFTGVFGCLTLCVVEIGRNGDNGLRYTLAKIILGSFFHFTQDECGYLRRGVLLTLRFNPCIAFTAVNDLVWNHVHIFRNHRIINPAADQTFDSGKCVFRICNSLTFSSLTNQTLVFCETYDRWRRARTFGVLNNFCLGTIHDGYAGVGSSKVNTDNFRHLSSFLAASVKLGSIMAPGLRPIR